MGEPTRGTYFSKTSYTHTPLPRFEQSRGLLPDLYWKAWEIAFKNFHEPARGSALVSQFIDAAFNENIFLSLGISSDGAFALKVSWQGRPESFAVRKGNAVFTV